LTVCALAILARRAYALVVDANEAVADAVAAEDRLRVAATPREDLAAFRPAGEVGTGILFASTEEILTVCTAGLARGAVSAFDRAVTPVGQRTAFNRDPE
jgi:hypothetical protein